MRIRLTLADSLALIAIAAIGLMVATQLGYEQDRWPEDFGLHGLPRRWPPGVLEALLTSSALVVGYATCRATALRVWWRRLPLLLAMVLLWFAVADYAVHHSYCKHCNRIQTDVAYRVYRYPVWQLSYESNARLSDISAELGVSCQHHDTRYQFVRLWGLIAPYPAICGILTLSDDEHTLDELRPHLHAMVAENPSLPEEFHREAIIAKNHAYFRQFMTDLKARLTATKNSRPQTPGAH